MDLITTPERNRSRRISMDEQNSSDGQTDLSIHEKKNILSTPSPPRDKQSQTKYNPSFLATPIQTRLIHSEDEDNNMEGPHSHKPESMLSPYTYTHNHNHGYSHTLSPVHKSRLLPPTTPKTRNTEMFLSPSPKLKSPNGNSSLITKDTKPIREISNDLKTRLNYAFVKLQNGWVDKTLPELEETLDHNNHSGITTKLVKSPEKFKSPIKRKLSNTSIDNNVFPSSYVNQFAYGNGDNLIPSNQPQNSHKTFNSIKQFNNKYNTNLSGTIENSKGISMEDSTTSAHLAFLQALASPDKKSQNGEIPKNTSPLKWGNSNDNNNQSNFNKLKTSRLDRYGKPVESEKEVVETLMSLSSPQKQKKSKNLDEDDTSPEETDIETESDND